MGLLEASPKKLTTSTLTNVSKLEDRGASDLHPVAGSQHCCFTLARFVALFASMYPGLHSHIRLLLRGTHLYHNLSQCVNKTLWNATFTTTGLMLGNANVLHCIVCLVWSNGVCHINSMPCSFSPAASCSCQPFCQKSVTPPAKHCLSIGVNLYYDCANSVSQKTCC